MAEENEMSVTVNVVSTLLLALLLLPKLRESGRKTGIVPTVSIIGSLVHWFTQFPERNEKEGIFVTLANREKANMNDRYTFSYFSAYFVSSGPSSCCRQPVQLRRD